MIIVPPTSIELTDFYPTLLLYITSGAFVGLVAGLSNTLIGRLPDFLESGIDALNLDYLAIARSVARQVILMMLAFSLFAYPIYSSGIVPKDESNTFLSQQVLFFTIFFPIASIIECFFVKDKK